MLGRATTDFARKVGNNAVPRRLRHERAFVNLRNSNADNSFRLVIIPDGDAPRCPSRAARRAACGDLWPAQRAVGAGLDSPTMLRHNAFRSYG